MSTTKQPAHNRGVKAPTRAEIQKQVVEIVSRMVRTGLVEKMLGYIDDMERPTDKFKASLEILKFGAPQLASQRLEIEGQEGAPVTRIVFSKSNSTTESEEPKLKKVEDK